MDMRPGSDFGSLPLLLFTRSLTELRAHRLLRLDGQQALEIILSLPLLLQCYGYRCALLCPALVCVYVDLNSGHVACVMGILPSHLSSQWLC